MGWWEMGIHNWGPFRLVAFRNSEFLLGLCKNRGVDDGVGLEW